MTGFFATTGCYLLVLVVVTAWESRYKFAFLSFVGRNKVIFVFVYLDKYVDNNVIFVFFLFGQVNPLIKSMGSRLLYKQLLKIHPIIPNYKDT